MSISIRKSHTELGKIYFWTATIHKWKPLLAPEENKETIIDYLRQLSDKELVQIYAFVIMPNHIHLIWNQQSLNGRETPKGSLLKHTSHIFLKQLKMKGKADSYRVNAANKMHEIWQRDSLGVELYNRETALQKLRYIHSNPVSGIWQLATDDLNYRYSSAGFYETGIDEFGFLKDLYKIFDGE